MRDLYPHRLSSGANNIVVVLSDTEVGKLFGDDNRSDIGSEAAKMRFANEINGLIVTFIRLDFHAETGSEMLVMERLYPLDFRIREVAKRELWLEVFLDEMKQLHSGGFVHRDINRPSGLKGLSYDNILLTERGLRLIDVGISAIQSQVGDNLFEKFVEVEQKELQEFAQFFLER